MSLFKKIAVGVSTIALPASMFFGNAVVTKAATAGGVYSTPDGTVWFVDTDMERRAFTSAGAFLSYGFLNWSQVVAADSSVTALPTGEFIAPADGRIFCATATKGSDVTSECSLITGSDKARFTSADVFHAQGHNFARAIYGDSSFLDNGDNISNGSAAHLPGVLINNGGTVQMVVEGGLWGIPSVDVFNTWGYSFEDVVPANSNDTGKSQIGIIPARVAGELVPTGITGGDDTPSANCDNLQGSTGSITTTAKSDYSGEDVGEGESEVPIMAFEVEADNDSDIAVTSVKVELDENGAGSTDLDDHASEVVVMFNGDVVGSADVDDFTEGATGTWTKTISLDCAAVGADETEEFVIAIDGNSTIDSDDQTQAWLVDVTSIRFEDADGVTTTENSDADAGSFPDLQKTFTWESFATASDIEMAVSLTEDADDINDAHVIDIDDTDDTDDAEILAFTIENEGDVDITVNDIPVVISTTGDEATKLLGATLWVDGDQISSDTVPTGGAVVFEDLDLDIDAGDSIDFVVAVDIQDTTGAADNGDTVQATVTVDDIDADDSEGDAISDANATGTAVGGTHAVYDAGIMVEFVSADIEKSVSCDGPCATGTGESAEATIVFDVTAFDADAYLTNGVDEDGTYTAGSGLTTTTTLSAAGGTSTGAYTVTDDEPGSTHTHILEGDTVRVTLVVNVTKATDPGFARVALSGIEWNDADSVVTPFNYTFDLTEFETSNIYLNQTD